MWDFQVGLSLQLLARTLPFLLLRCAVFFGIALAYGIVTSIGAGLGWMLGGLGGADWQGGGALIGALIGLGVTGFALYLLRAWLLYLVNAAHVAVLVRLLDHHAVPEGRSQVAYGRAAVQARFGEVNVLFGLDLLIKGALRVLITILRGLVGLLPLPGAQQSAGLVRTFLNMAVGLVDEVILAYSIRADVANPWRSARTALILYGQNARNLFKNAAWLTVFTYGLTLVVFVVMLIPAAGFALLVPGHWSALALPFAVALAWAFKAALIEPFAIACLLQAYFKVIQGQVPDPVWEQRLDSASAQFRELQTRAAQDEAPPAAPQG